jgi:threonine dehydrogenase-like Zn-dependent dehydrogenase
LDHLVKIF